MTDFQVGDRVRIREGSIYYDRNSHSNPAGVTGTVIEHDYFSRPMPLMVRWDERGANTYNDSDLEHVDEWVVVRASPRQEAEVWCRLTSRLEGIAGCTDYPAATQRIFLNLRTGRYTNKRARVPSAERGSFREVELTDIVGE